MRRFLFLGACIAAMLVMGIRPSLAQEADLSNPKLSQKVTVKEESTSLEKLMPKLSQQAGIKLSVDTRPAQWSVRERQVCIIVKDVPLRDVMTAMKTLLVYSWRADDSDGYILYQSEKDRGLELKLRQARIAAQKQARLARINGALSYLRRISQKSSRQTSQIRKSDPWGYLFSNWAPARATLNLLSSLPSGIFQQIAAGEKIQISIDQLTPRQREWMKIASEGMLRRQDELFQGSTPAPEGPTESAESAETEEAPSQEEVDPDNGAVIADPGGEPSLDAASPQRADETQRACYLSIEPPATNDDIFMNEMAALGLVFRDKSGSDLMQFVLPNLDTPASSIIGEAFAGAMIGSTSNPDEVEKTISGALSLIFKQKVASTKWIYTKENPPKDPDLLREVEPNGSSAMDWIESLTKENKLSIIKEAYPQQIDNLSPFRDIGVDIHGKKPLYQFLNELTIATDYTWAKCGSVYAWQSEEWFMRRAWDVPEQWMSYFRDALKKSGKLSVDDSLRMAGLTEEQIENKLGYGDGLQDAANWVMERRNLLLFYSTLSEQQRSRARSPEGLWINQLSPAQWKAALAALEKAQGSAHCDQNPEALLRNGIIHLQQEAEDGGDMPGQNPWHLVFENPEGASHSVGIEFIRQPEDESNPVGAYPPAE